MNNRIYLISKNLLFWRLLSDRKSIIEKYYNICIKNLLDVFLKKGKLMIKGNKLIINICIGFISISKKDLIFVRRKVMIT